MRKVKPYDSGFNEIVKEDYYVIWKEERFGGDRYVVIENNNSLQEAMKKLECGRKYICSVEDTKARMWIIERTRK